MRPKRLPPRTSISKKRLYALLKQSYYLPKLSSKAATLNYLKSIQENRCFTMTQPSLPSRSNIPLKTEEIYFEFKEQLDAAGVNITALTLPDKEWLIQACFAVNPQHQLFILHGTMVASSWDFFENSTGGTKTELALAKNEYLNFIIEVKDRTTKLIKAYKKERFTENLTTFMRKYPFLRLKPEITSFLLNIE